jgi:hypothetical protein
MKIIDSENCLTNFFLKNLKIEEFLKMGKNNLRIGVILKLAPKIETNDSHDEKVRIIQHWSIHVRGLSDPTSMIALVPF